MSDRVMLQDMNRKPWVAYHRTSLLLTGPVCSVQTYLQQHKELDWVVQQEHAGKPATLRTAVFQYAMFGCHVHVSVVSMYEQLGLKLYPCNACDWFQRRAQK